MGIEPTSEAWEASILPLYDARSAYNLANASFGSKAADFRRKSELPFLKRKSRYSAPSCMWTPLWSRLHIMETVQIVVNKKLLRAADEAARRTKRNRSTLVRDVLLKHLRRLAIRGLEERARVGYSKRRQSHDEASTWEAEAVWPAE